MSLEHLTPLEVIPHPSQPRRAAVILPGRLAFASVGSGSSVKRRREHADLNLATPVLCVQLNLLNVRVRVSRHRCACYGLVPDSTGSHPHLVPEAERVVWRPCGGGGGAGPHHAPAPGAPRVVDHGPLHQPAVVRAQHARRRPLSGGGGSDVIGNPPSSHTWHGGSSLAVDLLAGRNTCLAHTHTLSHTLKHSHSREALTHSHTTRGAPGPHPPVSKGLHSPDLWERRRATTSGMSTMQPTKILLFPAVFDRPRELLKPARKAGPARCLLVVYPAIRLGDSPRHYHIGYRCSPHHPPRGVYRGSPRHPPHRVPGSPRHPPHVRSQCTSYWAK